MLITDDMSRQEKERVIKEIEQQQKNMYRNGKIIVFIIATMNILASIMAFIFTYSLTVIIQVPLSMALYGGVAWVRYLFAVGATIGAIQALSILLGGYMGSDTPGLLILFFVFYLVYEVASAIMLLTNKSVSEFLYAQKNG